MCHIGFHTRPQFMDKTAAKGYLLPLSSEVRLNSDLITRLLPRAKWNAESIHQAKCSTKREYHEKNSEAFQWGWSFAILLGAREMQLGEVIFSKRLSTFSTCLLMFQSSYACVVSNHNVISIFVTPRRTQCMQSTAIPLIISNPGININHEYPLTPQTGA